MNDYSKLKELAEGCRDEVIRSDGWAGMIGDAALLRRDEQFLKECSPEAILALIADLERHQRMLLAAACDIGAIGQAMGADSEDDGSDLEGLAAELRKDAERYRWLRDPVRVDWEDITGELVVGQAEGEDILWMMSLDAAIDEAMDVEVTP